MAAQPRKTTPHPMPEQEILNIDGAAAFLGVSVKTFSKVLREGDVPGRKVGREWKFSRQALVEWIGHSSSRAFLDDGEDEAEGELPRVATSGADGARTTPRRARAGAGPSAAGAASAEAGGGRKRKGTDNFSVDEL
jgi:excisionase family DNA binding protein